MEIDQVQTSGEERLFATDGRHEDGDDSGGSGGASSFGNRGPDGSRSDRHHSSMGTLSRLRSPVDTSLDSQMTEGELKAATSSLQLESKAAADVPLNSDSAESEEQGQTDEEIDTQNADAPLGTLWHLEYQTLEEQQDVVLDAAASALAERLRASIQIRSTQATGRTVAECRLLNFLVSTESLPAVGPRQREKTEEEWEERVHWRNFRRSLEKHHERTQ